MRKNAHFAFATASLRPDLHSGSESVNTATTSIRKEGATVQIHRSKDNLSQICLPVFAKGPTYTIEFSLHIKFPQANFYVICGNSAKMILCNGWGFRNFGCVADLSRTWCDPWKFDNDPGRIEGLAFSDKKMPLHFVVVISWERPGFALHAGHGVLYRNGIFMDFRRFVRFLR